MLRVIRAARKFSGAQAAFLAQAEDLHRQTKVERIQLEQKNAELLKELNNEHLPKEGVYRHPYCTEDHPLAIEGKHMIRAIMDVVGPEQVSPHYQSLEEYGKWFTYFLVTFAFCFNMRDNFNHAFGYSMLNLVMGAEIYLYMAFFYILRNNVMSVPNPWKTMWINYNITQMLDNIYEDMEIKTLDKKVPAINQMDYHRLHREYLGMKAKLLNHHLDVSKIGLKQHAYQRIVAALKMVEQFEVDNLNKEFKKLLDEAVQGIYTELNGENSQQIQEQALRSAIQGIKEGKMTYKNDPILPIVIQKIQDFQEKISSMSQEEMVELVQLKKEQKATIKEMDKAREKTFMLEPPPIKHPRITSSPNFQDLHADH